MNEEWLRQAYKKAYLVNCDLRNLDGADTFVNRASNSVSDITSNLEHLIRAFSLVDLEKELGLWMKNPDKGNYWIISHEGMRIPTEGCHRQFGNPDEAFDREDCCGEKAR